LKKIFVILLLAFSVVALFADDLQTVTAPNWFCDAVVAKRGREMRRLRILSSMNCGRR